MAIAERRTRPTKEQVAAAEAAIASLDLTVTYIITEFTVEFLAGKVGNDQYYVPPYQREFIWNETSQSRFIESILMGLPIPFIFLWQDPDGNHEIVDGSQRLRTLVPFSQGI